MTFHIHQIIPIGREGSTDAPITDLPCNKLAAGDSVATFVAGAKTQLAYSITEVHDASKFLNSILNSSFVS